MTITLAGCEMGVMKLAEAAMAMAIMVAIVLFVFLRRLSTIQIG